LIGPPAHAMNRVTSWRRGKTDTEEERPASVPAQVPVLQSPLRTKQASSGTSVHHSHKWVRPATESAMHDGGIDDGNGKKVPAKAAAHVVLGGETKNAGSDTGTAIESSNAITSTIIQTASEEPEANKLPAPTAANLQRRGRNKLVLWKDPEESRAGHNASSKSDAMDATVVAATADNAAQAEPASAAASHARRGRNKLVLSKGPEEHNESYQDAPDKRRQQQHQYQSESQSYNSMPFVSSKRWRKRPRPAQSSAVPKRIKMVVPGPQEDDDQEGDGDDGSVGDKREYNGAAAVAMTEKLTDFTYRETSAAVSTRGRGRGRGRGGGWGGRTHPPARSMGLQRVLPDVSTTPVCRSFLRGITCVNETCAMRHDIPKEFALPICSYFQSHGMCLKKDCPFRHIKVNPHATACPSFALLGFCETPGCTMQHTRARPQNNNLVWKGGQG
jgi:hypothetical protein